MSYSSNINARHLEAPAEPGPELLGTPQMSFVAIGQVLGMSKSNVQRIEAQALKKLRASLVKRLGAEYFEGEVT